MSDPGQHTDMIVSLPSEVATLNRIIQGVLIHSDWLSEYGLHGSQYDAVSRATRSVSDRLDDILKADGRNIDGPRRPAQRSIGTCRDFALVLCSILRTKGIAARVRCGFASYFSNGWEDHWLCEYWDQRLDSWRLSDPQVDEIIAQYCQINFEPHDVPRKSFLSAGEAWLKYRAGNVDPTGFGHGDVTGPWFMMVNVFRDHYVLNGRETSDWDSWRNAPVLDRHVPDRYLMLADEIAAHPDGKLDNVPPPWKWSGPQSIHQEA